jgi:hypothetical protein
MPRAASQARGSTSQAGAKQAPGKPQVASRPSTSAAPNVPRPPSGQMRMIPPQLNKVNGPPMTPLMPGSAKMMPPNMLSPQGMAPQRSPMTGPPPGRSMSNMQPPHGMPLGMPMFGRPPSTGGMPNPMSPMQQISPQNGQGRAPGQSPQGGFGAIGVGPPPGVMRPNGAPSPFLHSPSPPGLHNQLTSPTIGQPHINGVAPIGPPRHGSISSPTVLENPLAALNLGSQVAQARAASSDIGAIGGSSIQRGPSGSVKPIGRGRLSGASDTQEDLDTIPSSSTSASLRSPSPPPTLGSAALLEDFEEVPDDKLTSSGVVTSPGFPTHSAFSGTSWGAESGIWGANPSSQSSWSAEPARPQELERSDIIRVSTDSSRWSNVADLCSQARSGIACLHLNDTTGRFHHTAQDVYRILLATYPDSATVDLQELISSCAAPANAVNGGGRFTIQQEGAQVLLSFDPGARF